MQGFLIIRNLPAGQFVARVVGLAMRPFLEMRISACSMHIFAHIYAQIYSVGAIWHNLMASPSG